jgi:hypothetical protein
MLDSIVTMDKTMVSYNTLETKKQGIKKGQPCPLKAEVHSSQTKQMLLAVLDRKGLIYIHIKLRGASINASASSRSWATS